jgi:hypothetical protein
MFCTIALTSWDQAHRRWIGHTRVGSSDPPITPLFPLEVPTWMVSTWPLTWENQEVYVDDEGSATERGRVMESATMVPCGSNGGPSYATRRQAMSPPRSLWTGFDIRVADGVRLGKRLRVSSSQQFGENMRDQGIGIKRMTPHTRPCFVAAFLGDFLG